MKDRNEIRKLGRVKYAQTGGTFDGEPFEEEIEWLVERLDQQFADSNRLQRYLAMIIESALLKDLLILTRDGEWGKDEPSAELEAMGVIRGTDFKAVRYGNLDNVPIRYIPKKKADYKRLKPYDILIETAGGTKDQPTGRTVFLNKRLFEGSDLPLICARSSRFLRVDTTVIWPRYLFWYLQYLYSTRQMTIYHVQHSGPARFHYSKFAESTYIPLPTIEEQKSISAVLRAFDDKIELNRQMNAKLDEMARAIFKSWFVDFEPVRAKVRGEQPNGMDAETAALFPDSFEVVNGREVPACWRVSTIGAEINTISGGTPSSKNPDYWQDGTVSFATPKDLSQLQSPVLLDTARCITDEGLNKISSGVLPEGTVLMSSRAPVGSLAINAIPIAINQDFIAMQCNKSLSKYYVLWWAKENMHRIEKRASDTTCRKISKKNFRPLDVIVSPKVLVGRFDEKVGPLFERIVSNEKDSRTLAELRDTLLPRLMSGQLRVM